MVGGERNAFRLSKEWVTVTMLEEEGTTGKVKEIRTVVGPDALGATLNSWRNHRT